MQQGTPRGLSKGQLHSWCTPGAQEQTSIPDGQLLLVLKTGAQEQTSIPDGQLLLVHCNRPALPLLNTPSARHDTRTQCHGVPALDRQTDGPRRHGAGSYSTLIAFCANSPTGHPDAS
eukprot:1159054-Pelagomonas_calceolata.AAC.7